MQVILIKYDTRRRLLISPLVALSNLSSLILREQGLAQWATQQRNHHNLFGLIEPE